MIYLLDTNVISQRRAERPDAAVLHFLNTLRDEQSFISVMTLMEIRVGSDKLSLGSEKRNKLELWLEQDIPRSFTGRILPVTAVIADVAGRLFADEKKNGRTPGIADLLIAATAKVYGMQISYHKPYPFRTARYRTRKIVRHLSSHWNPRRTRIPYVASEQLEKAISQRQASQRHAFYPRK